MTNIVVMIIEEALSDRSKVHNVVVREQGFDEAIVLPAITPADATLLAEKIVEAINNHTSMKAEQR